jgi:hypothetical protein
MGQRLSTASSTSCSACWTSRSRSSSQDFVSASEVVCAYYVVDELLGLASDICDLVVRDDGLTRVLPEQDLGGPEALPARVGHRVHELEHGHLAQGAEAHDDVLDLIE